MLVSKINNHVQQALARQMQQYLALATPYINVLNGSNPFVPTGTYTQISATAPQTNLGFGYGSLVGVAQAFYLSSPTDIGQLTLYFQAQGVVSSGYLTAYLYMDNGQSPSIYAVPIGGPVQQSVEVYDAAAVANDWQLLGTSGYLPLTFTFDYNFQPGYYWIVIGSNFSATPGNSLVVGLNNTGGLAFANGFTAGTDITGVFGANGQSGSKQIAMKLAYKSSAPPLGASNSVNVSGIGTLISTFADRIQVLENAAYPINEERQLFNGLSYPATGAQLDGIGALVGVSRNGLSDQEYLIFILGQIGENYSNGTIPEIASLVSLMFQTETFMLMPLYPAELDIQIPATAGLQTALYPQAITLIANSVDAGIGVGFGSVYPANPFAFTSVGGPQIGGGFGDLNNPSVGGGFASLFYSNPGV